MSEDQLEPSLDESVEMKLNKNVRSENAIAPKATQGQADDDDDLEDGEIDDDDDNDESIATVDSNIAATTGAATTGAAATAAAAKKINQPPPVHNVVSSVEAKNEPVKKSKLKKHVIEDDFAGSVESAIAAALKKDGIMPPMPKILESREDSDKLYHHNDIDKSTISKSSRRRKRRKLRDEREKERDKKKSRASSSDAGHLTSTQPGGDEELDDDEMLCVRGGSPPPSGLMLPLPTLDSNTPTTKKENYDSDGSYSSYNSYDSGHNYPRYSSSRKKDGSLGNSSASRLKRKERGNRRDDDRRPEKRNRRNYDDSGGEDKYQDRHSQQPRKMELCKFYLMECCAKKDKCSYMHSDFPCKYYYLGMDCVYRSACKFSHGKPLSDQLRNILLKHLETAPKEILGTFRRISRENALIQINATHEKICQEQGVENTLAPATNITQSIVQTQAGSMMMRNGDIQVQQQQQSQQGQSGSIPSLLDIVINPPSSVNETSPTLSVAAASSGSVSNQKPEKQRKSRWCDLAVMNPTASKQNSLEPPSSNAPSYLDLENLTGILSPAHIGKLSQFGIVNLEQINQLTLSQLNNIGLTIAEISEIQLNARNMAKLGVTGRHSDDAAPSANVVTSSTTVLTTTSASLCLPLTASTTTTMSTVMSEKSAKCSIVASPDRQQTITATPVVDNLTEMLSASATMGGIDYSQYLRDSNLGYDRNDLLDDEKDEEQLVIDDQDLDALVERSPLDANNKDVSENDSKESASFSGGGDSNDLRLPPAIQLSDKVQNLLNDPSNLYTVDVSTILKTNELLPSTATPKLDDFSVSFDDDGFYGTGVGSSRHDIDAREEHRDSRQHLDIKEEYRDPRLIATRTSEQSSNSQPMSFPFRHKSNSDSESGRSRSQSPVTSGYQHQAYNPTLLYERPSMYDWTPKCIQEDLEYSTRSTKADKDMRLAGFLDSSNSDIDLRLPFQPVKNIQISKEIDASMSTLMPISYKIVEIDIPEPKYNDLRQSFQCEDSADPRLRRILGLPELSNSKILAALGRSSNPTIASPSSAESSSSPTRDKDNKVLASVGPRIDPRRAAAAAMSSTAVSLGATQNSSVPTGNPQQNVEIRMLLQKSDWYKNLNSKFKIMVNQQLALVSTELKRFHQDPSPNKVFDIQFILNNQNLQQILTNLGIYIDDSGQVAHIDNELDILGGGCVDFGAGSHQSNQMMINNPNMMAMQQHMEFLHGPPPNMNMVNMGGNGPMRPLGGSQQGIFTNGAGGMQSFGRNPRLSILGIPTGPGGSGGGGFNPFAGNSGDSLLDHKFCGPNNPFGSNFTSNGINFGGQQMNRSNRNNFNRLRCGSNAGNRLNQNRRGYKSNNSRDRRGGGNSGSNTPGNNNSAIGGAGSGVSQNSIGGAEDS